MYRTHTYLSRFCIHVKLYRVNYVYRIHAVFFFLPFFPRYILPEVLLYRVLLRLPPDYFLAASSYSKKSIAADKGAEKHFDKEQEEIITLERCSLESTIEVV